MSEADYCIVGSGPTGVTAARALLAAGARVTMLDGGITLEPERQMMVRRLADRNPEEWDKDQLAALQGHVNASSKGLQVKTVFGSRFPYARADELLPRDARGIGHFTPSLARGGFSNVWGAAMMPYTSSDLEAWPITESELAQHYSSVLDGLDCSIAHDGLAEAFPLYTQPRGTLRLSRQASGVLDRLEAHRDQLARHGLLFGRARLAMRAEPCRYCGLCLQGCPYGLIHSSADHLTELESHSRFRYLPGHVVDRLSEGSNGVELFTRDLSGSASTTFRAPKVLLAAGVISSTRIILASLGAFSHPIRLLASEYFLVPLFLRSGISGVAEERLHTLSQLFLEYRNPEVSRHWIHGQLYSYSNLFDHGLRHLLRLAGPLKGLFIPGILRRMLALQGYLHSDESSFIEMTLESPKEGGRVVLEGTVNPRARSIVRAYLRKLLALSPQLGFVTLPPLAQVGPPGEGRHVGGAFPMRASPGEFESDRLGRPHGMTNVHILDASVFPSIPAPTITLTAMANAERIALQLA